MSFSLMADQLGYEFLTGKWDNMYRKIVKEEYFTFIRSEMENSWKSVVTG